MEKLEEKIARRRIQKIIDNHDLKATILFNGNQVWSKKLIIRNLKQIIKHKKLYRGKVPPKYQRVANILVPPDGGKLILTKYFYDFLHLNCGSIAHYNIYGWVAHYPTLEDLKEFFKHNEFGKRVLHEIPWWKTDARRIVLAIERQLFPFNNYFKKSKSFLG
jgi:hypothetical protein